MKTIINRYLTGFLMLNLVMIFFVSGCQPKEVVGPEMGPAPTSDQLNFTVDYTTPNIVQLTNQSAVDGIPFWDFGNNQSGKGQKQKVIYPYKGDYVVTMTLYGRGGSAKIQKTVTIDTTDLSLMCDDETLNLISGGCDNHEGKVWVWDQTMPGHFGVGPADSDSPIWWSAAPNDKAGLGLYDDRMIFSMDGMKFTYDNHGDTYVNKDFYADFGLASAPSADFTAEYTPSDQMTWNVVESDGKKILSFTHNGFMSYYYGVPVSYEIKEISEDKMYLISRHDGLAWFYHFKVEDTVAPPPEEKPYKAVDMFDNFDTPGTMTWNFQGGDDGSLDESADNPDASGLNTSDKVAKYVRGTSFAYANAQFILDYRMDLTTRNKFKVMVYLPSSNTSLSADNQTVALKLQNSLLGGNAWTTQEERKVHIDQLDQWVEVTFDFSDVTDRTDFDQVVLQIGGEGHSEPGTFYFDDFALLGGASQPNYTLVWEDDFSQQTALDPAKWGFDIGTGNSGWGNNELEYYTDRPENVKIEDGVLKITALKENYSTSSYTSARIKTQGKFSFKYGRVEAEIKLPSGAGIWPAFWMLGSNITTVGWPACGEADIMEYIGKDPDVIHGSIHTPSSHGNTVNTATLRVPGVENDFHLYAIEWDESKIDFYVDKILYYTYKPSVYDSDTWPFNQNFFLILNVAVGGNFGGTVDDSIFPQTMEVKSVRVYQNSETR